MLNYDDYYEGDPNEPGTYVPPGVPQEDPNAFRDQFPADWNYGQVGQNEAYNPFNTPALPRTTNTQQGMSEADGRAYDAANGLLGGYMGPNGWVSGEPRSGGPPPPGYSPGNPNAQFGGQAPMLDYPAWQSAGPFQPRDDTFDFQPFSYEAFAPSSYGDLEKQPGFGEGQARLQKQIEAGAAHRGMLRSGMTLGDLWSGLDTNKQQRFAEFDGRRARDYSMNRGNAFETWGANLGANRDKFLDEYTIDKDKHSFQATDVDRGNNYRFNAADASFKDALARWSEQVRSLTQLSQPPG